MDIYGLNTDANVVYDWYGKYPTDEGNFLRDGTIVIGKSAMFTDSGELQSPGFLAATIAHEEVHYDQYERGQSFFNATLDDGKSPTKYQSQVLYMNEHEAYKSEIYYADNYRLSGSEVKEFTRRANSYYYALSPENRTKALGGDYDLVNRNWH
jgi:hypothetical protein